MFSPATFSSSYHIAKYLEYLIYTLTLATLTAFGYQDLLRPNCSCYHKVF